jgi:serine/threonine protein kinase
MGAAATPGLTTNRFDWEKGKTIAQTLGGCVSLVNDRSSPTPSQMVIKSSDWQRLEKKGPHAKYEQVANEASNIWWLHERKVPNVIVCHGQWRVDNGQRVMTAMEYAEDGDLFNDMDKQSWSWARTRTVTRQIVHTLGAIHAHRRCFLDLALENLVFIDAKRDRIRFIDVARLQETQCHVHRRLCECPKQEHAACQLRPVDGPLTCECSSGAGAQAALGLGLRRWGSSGAEPWPAALGLARPATLISFFFLVGRLYLAAPEVFTHKKVNGRHADFWALGVLLFMMITDAQPWVSCDRCLARSSHAYVNE